MKVSNKNDNEVVSRGDAKVKIAKCIFCNSKHQPNFIPQKYKLTTKACPKDYIFAGRIGVNDEEQFIKPAEAQKFTFVDSISYYRLTKQKQIITKQVNSQSLLDSEGRKIIIKIVRYSMCWEPKRKIITDISIYSMVTRQIIRNRLRRMVKRLNWKTEIKRTLRKYFHYLLYHMATMCVAMLLMMVRNNPFVKYVLVVTH